MVQITFFEKPGCTNNTRQKQWLMARGVRVEAVDILTYPWSVDELLAFFGGLPVNEWFNQSAPRVKSSEVVPEQLSQRVALQLLLHEPLLIRRPLLRKGDARKVGFDRKAIAVWLGIHVDDESTGPGESCPRPARPCDAEEEI